MVNIIMIQTPMYPAKVASQPGPPIDSGTGTSGACVSHVSVNPYCTPAQITAATSPKK